MKVHIATSREIGEECKRLVSGLVGMEECDTFISILYDKILTDDFIRSKRACFNFHPAVLPEYRGIGAYTWVILNGEKESGVTLHLMDGEIDHGPIIDIQRFPITDTDTAGTVYAKAEATILRMFRAWYDRLLAGDFTATEQDHSRARMYYRKDLEQAPDLTRHVRALTFPGRYRPCYRDSHGTMHELEY
jgi:methionyl-tRNA formyltransferase